MLLLVLRWTEKLDHRVNRRRSNRSVKHTKARDSARFDHVKY